MVTSWEAPQWGQAMAPKSTRLHPRPEGWRHGWHSHVEQALPSGLGRGGPMEGGE